jgi:hypothetical protein
MENEFTPANIYIASFLYAHGCELLTVIPGGNRSADFVFKSDGGEAEQRACEFYENKPEPVRACFEALRQLKTEADQARWRSPKP